VKSIRRVFSAVALCAAIVACDDLLGPKDIAGAYTATAFTITPTGQAATDVLGAGGSLTMTLFADGTTTGQLSVPASINNGVPITLDMAGTFSVTGKIVTFDQAADSFVRDLPFTANGNTLTGSASFSGTAVSVTLTRP